MTKMKNQIKSNSTLYKSDQSTKTGVKTLGINVNINITCETILFISFSSLLK